jgi:phosphoribosyl 1,2-cyclic phosphodiesterase
MSLFITSINSGSNGNCYYIANSREAVLVDVGISCREVLKRMTRLGLSMEKVKAIFISHEHSDHIRGVEVLSRRYKVPVYINDATLKNSRIYLEEELRRPFNGSGAIPVGDLTVTPFPKSHDASDPYSFVVEGEGVRIGVLTDIGVPCEQVIRHFSQCHAAFLEANYDEQMLSEGRYPFYLKRRISSDKGHLSNHQALELFIKHKPDFMSLVLLSHLSKENNDPALVHELFSRHAADTHVIVASRYEESPVFQVTAGPALSLGKKDLRHEQMSLF